MLDFKEDIFNGLTIKNTANSKSFALELQELIEFAISKDKNLIWLTLSSKDGDKIAIALEFGFVFHSCSQSELVLVLKLKDVFVPFMPTHTVGVGGIVIANNKILLIKEKLKSHRSKYKIPGGMVEPGSSLEESVIREVYEETGIKCECEKMVALLNAHPYRFNKSNTYYIFKLKPLNFDINIIDTDEIELAIWYDLEAFFADDKIGNFQNNLVKRALSNNGLYKLDANRYFDGKGFAELYL